MKRTLILLAWLTLSFVSAGCVSTYYGQYDQEEATEADSLRALAMTTADIIALVKEGINDDVIIGQIKATASYFQLSTDEIIVLKKAGASDKVISAMIKSTEPRPGRRTIRRYYGSGNYPYTALYGYPLYYPWYSSVHLGFPYGHHYPYSHFGYYGGHYGVGHYSGGHGYGGHRSFGSHR